MKAYDDYDGLGLAELVRAKEVSPEELVEAAIERIDRYDGVLNAVIHRLYAQGRQLARSEELGDGPFRGVPFLVKDLLTTCAGAPYSKGCRALAHNISPADSELMKRFRAAGLVTLGKTNTPEFGLLAVTEPAAFGPTRNPWDPARTPGGSSGGSAAAVAAGFVPLAGGGDGGGSIRIPASCCGLFGLKPSRGRVPAAPHGEHWQGAAQEHVLTRSVRDSAAALDAVQGCAPGAPYRIAPPAGSYLLDTDSSPGTLRIAFTTRSPLDTPVADSCVTALQQTVRLLEELGHRVEERAPQYDGQALARSFLTMYFGEVAADLEELASLLGRRVRREDVEPLTWLFGLMGRTVTAGEFVRSKRLWNDVGRAMGEFHQHYDLLLTPTLAVEPVALGSTGTARGMENLVVSLVNTFGLGRLLEVSGLLDRIAIESLARTPFTQLANLTGQPAMSVPLHWTKEGLPVGVQFVAPWGEESRLFRLAAQLERARPWFDRRPDLSRLQGAGPARAADTPQVSTKARSIT